MEDAVVFVVYMTGGILMNILFDARVFNNNLTGIAKSTLYLYKACYDIDNSFHAFGVSDMDLCQYNGNGITMLTVNFTKNLQKQIDEICKKYDIEIFHFPANGDIYNKNRSIANVVTIHDVLPLEIPNFYGDYKNCNFIYKLFYIKKIGTYYRKIWKSIIKSKAVFTVSKYSANSIKKYFMLKNTPTVIYHGVTLPIENEVYELKKDINYILYWGGYSKRKGIEELVRAYYEFIRINDIDVKLVLVGEHRFISDWLEEKIEVGKRNGLIIETGYVTDEELMVLIKNATMMCYLSKYEGFGLPIIEAMALGCPVITTRGTCIPEIAGEAAIFVEPSKPKDITEAMVKILNDKEFVKSQISKGKENLKRFSYKDSAQIFMDSIKNLLN